MLNFGMMISLVRGYVSDSITKTDLINWEHKAASGAFFLSFRRLQHIRQVSRVGGRFGPPKLDEMLVIWSGHLNYHEK